FHFYSNFGARTLSIYLNLCCLNHIMTSIFVAKLDFGVSNQELRQLFEQYGTVLKATVATDRETGKPRGFAFVEMADRDEAQQAIRALDGHVINGRALAVKEAEQRTDSRPASKPFQPRENSPERSSEGFTPRQTRPVDTEEDSTHLHSSSQKLNRAKKQKKKTVKLRMTTAIKSPKWMLTKRAVKILDSSTTMTRTSTTTCLTIKDKTKKTISLTTKKKTIYSQSRHYFMDIA
ncbi:MAG: RNA recognition motif domain-containing protein, partial [Sphingomonadales bacterium]